MRTMIMTTETLLEQKPDQMAERMARLEARADELIWASTFQSVTAKSSWFRNKSLAPGRWALGYPALYILYRVLNEMRPKNILELGLGQSTRMIAQYAAHYKGVRHTVVEHDKDWVAFCKKDMRLSDLHRRPLWRRHEGIRESGCPGTHAADPQKKLCPPAGRFRKAR